MSESQTTERRTLTKFFADLISDSDSEEDIPIFKKKAPEPAQKVEKKVV